MPSLTAGIRVVGTPEMFTKLGNIRREPQRVMRQAALERASKTARRFQTELTSEYTSAWSTKQIARSVKSRVKNEKDGVSISFSANSGARDHIKYITGVFPDSYFKTFPVEPFTIKPVDYGDAHLLRIRFPGKVRGFIRNPDTGKMEGSRAGGILKSKVLWGSQTGGFKRDVISEVSQSEGQIFVAEMMAAVQEALNKASQ